MKLVSGEVVKIPEVVRTVCHSTLINTYTSFCKESGYEPLSSSTVYNILQSCPASKRTNLKGLDNIAADGTAAYDSLSKIVFDLQPHAMNENEKLKEISCQQSVPRDQLQTACENGRSLSWPLYGICIDWQRQPSLTSHVSAWWSPYMWPMQLATNCHLRIERAFV